MILIIFNKLLSIHHILEKQPFCSKQSLSTKNAMLDSKLRTGTSQRNKIEIKLLCLPLAAEVLEYILLVPAVKNDHFFHTSPEIHFHKTEFAHVLQWL